MANRLTKEQLDKLRVIISDLRSMYNGLEKSDETFCLRDLRLAITYTGLVLSNHLIKGIVY